jgi:hypothetical protein
VQCSVVQCSKGTILEQDPEATDVYSDFLPSGRYGTVLHYTTLQCTSTGQLMFIQTFCPRVDTAPYSTARGHTVQCSAVQCSAVQCSAVQCSAVLSTARGHMVQDSIQLSTFCISASNTLLLCITRWGVVLGVARQRSVSSAGLHVCQGTYAPGFNTAEGAKTGL